MSESAPVTLDQLEAQFLAAAERRVAPGDVLNLLSAAEPHGLFPDAPPLDPLDARRSTAELRLLYHALFGPPAPAPPVLPENAPLRAGYLLSGEGDARQARVIPAFAARLATGTPLPDLRRHFPDLWAIDLELWQALDGGDARRVALLWLTSPGRRLLADLDALLRAPLDQPLGSADLSLDRLYRAAGVADLPIPDADADAWRAKLAPWLARRPLPWRELHTAIPGELLNHWHPSPDDVAIVLRLLESPDDEAPTFLLAPVLAWLLDHTVDRPFYAVEGIRRDLREDLPARLASRLAHPPAASPALEEMMLRHAARLTAGDDGPGAVLRRWGIARWLHRCLLRSPFFGGDAEGLTVRLRALLPSEPSAATPPAKSPPPARDALDPSRFGRAGLDIEDMALVAGAVRHYFREGALLLPTPTPLVDALRKLANRSLRPAERDAEQRHAAHPSELDWHAPHVAPPLVARWLLTRLHVDWLQQLDAPTLRECIDEFVAAPGRHAWLGHAVASEGAALAPALQDLLAHAWRSAVQKEPAPAPTLARDLSSMASGLLDRLTPEEAERARMLAHKTDPQDLPFVLDALGAAAQRSGQRALETQLIEDLFRLIEDAALPTETRLKAALVALRRMTSSRLPERDPHLARLAQLLAAPPFAAHVGLRRELRRLGLADLSSPDLGRHKP